MFGSYSVTAHFADRSSEAIGYGSLPYCLAEADRLNAEIEAKRGAGEPTR